MSLEKKCEDTLLSLDEVLDSTKGFLIYVSTSFYFKNVQTDSRSVTEGTLFIPLVGQLQDGHKYIDAALKNGASVIFIENEYYLNNKNLIEKYCKEFPSVTFIGTQNNLHALQYAAARYVEKFPNLIRIGVTGSSGKTTTKEIALSLLKTKYNVIANKGNLNSETGLPLSVFEIRSEHEAGLFEMGMNRKEEIAELAFVLKPQYAIITNIGSAHIGILGSRENIAHEKSNIFKYFDSTCTAIIPFDDDFTDYLTSRAQSAGKILYYGEKAPSSICTFKKDLGLMGTEFSVRGTDLVLNLPGKYNYKNAQAAITLADTLGISPNEIKNGLASMPHLFGRSEVRSGKYTIVQDCYNANPDSMSKALELCSSVELEEGKEKVFVLGDMLELGSDSYNAHKTAALEACHSDAKIIFFVGKEMKAAYDAAINSENKKTHFVYFESKDDCVIREVCKEIKEKISLGSLILIKASRGMQLERLTKVLEGEDVK